MTKKKKKAVKRNEFLIILVVIIICGVYVFFQTKPKLVTVKVVSEIEDYNYYIESNATKIYKKYFKELEEEIKDNKIDEEKYAELISKLFIIDYYTLNNKVTNKDIGGVQFICSDLKKDFIDEAGSSTYKYVKNNLYGNRKQELPEVKDVKIEKIEKIKYKNKDYKDDSGYKVTTSVEYVKDLKYPKKVELNIIHEDNKLVIVEIK